MRPRPEGRGERRGRDSRARRLGASMRPRPEGRGERHRGKEGRRRLGLQCGHDPKAVENIELTTADGARFNAATTRRPWRTLPRDGRLASGDGLQCGHDPKAVENRRRRQDRRPE